MKKILGLVLGLLLMVGFAEASSSPDLPTTVRLVGPLGTYTGTIQNPSYMQYSSQVNDVLDEVMTVKEVATVTIVSIVKQVDNVTSVDTVDTVTSVTSVTTVATVTALGGIATDVGIKDNGNVISVDSTQLPAALDGLNLKVHEQGTVNVKLDSTIATPLGEVRITDGTDDAAVNTDGSFNVVVSGGSQGGTPVTGYYAVSVGAGATVEIGSYTTTGTTVIEGYNLTNVGESLAFIKVAGANKCAVATNPINSTINRYVGNNFQIPTATVLSITVTNNEASAIIAYFSWHGTIK